MRAAVLFALAIACGGTPAGPRRSGPDPVDPRCALPEPAVIEQDGNAVLLRWDLPFEPFWFEAGVPDDPTYLAYRRAIREAGADLAQPIADEPLATTEAERELWRRERENAALTYGGAGRVRRIGCLEAALFAHQHARYDELVQPTELVATVLRRDAMMRIYFGASDAMFPPKAVYGLDEARADVANGWRLIIHLHNHTLQKRAGKPALGAPSPSTSDVELLRGLAEELHLERVWVTNGMFTGEVPASALGRYRTRE